MSSEVIISRGRRRKDRRVVFWILGVFAFLLLFTFLTQRYKSANEVEAANMKAFDPGYIISDWQMGNYNSMNEAEIQAFLKSKNSCRDTGLGRYTTGAKVDYFSEISPPRTWHVTDGHFVCMADEVFDGGTAAHIIWQAAQDYRINPQVLIVLLEKEQSLITDTFPHSQQYRSATGYGCPDTAPCSSQYYGLQNQVRKAAELYRAVLDGGWTNYPLGWNYVQYNPDSGCGGTMVNIRSLATSALYRYTPYQPNDVALSGGNDGCGAYGNMNFYRLFEDWFGGITATSVSDERPLAEGDYYVAQKGDKGKVLDVAGISTVAGANLDLWSRDSSRYQIWRMIYDDGYYRIQDVHSSLFVDLYGASTVNGTNIQLWTRNDTCSQKWRVEKTDDDYYIFISACGEKKVIDLAGDELDDGTNIRLWDEDGSVGQRWKLVSSAAISEGSYVLAAKKNGARVLDVNGAAKSNGANVQLWDQHRGGAQIWYIRYNEKTDDYTLVNPNSGKALDAQGASSDDGTNIQLWELNDSCAQRWKIIRTNDNYYSLMSSCADNSMLDMYGASTNNGTNVQLWHNNLGDAQKWSLIPASVVANGLYSIESRLGEKQTLDVYGASSVNGSNVQLWAGTQKWQIIYDYDTGYYTVTNLGKALDAYGAFMWNDANVQLWAQNPTCAQQWRILKTPDGYYTFMNRCSQSYVLDAKNENSLNGANVRLWLANNQDTQKWNLRR